MLLQDVSLSVRLSVCLSHADIVSKWLNISSHFFSSWGSHIVHCSSFSEPNLTANRQRTPANGGVAWWGITNSVSALKDDG